MMLSDWTRNWISMKNNADESQKISNLSWKLYFGSIELSLLYHISSLLLYDLNIKEIEELVFAMSWVDVCKRREQKIWDYVRLITPWSIFALLLCRKAILHKKYLMKCLLIEFFSIVGFAASSNDESFLLYFVSSVIHDRHCDCL